MKKFWIIFFSLIFSLNLFSAWEKDYLLALKKYEKKDFFEAIKLLEKAVRDNPNSCEKCIREGMFFYDYFPHFYLAKSYLSINDNENFKKEMEILKREGKIISNSKLSKEYHFLLQSIKEEEKIAEKEPEKKEEIKTEKIEEKKEKEPEKIAEKKEEQKVVEKTIEKKEKLFEKEKEEKTQPLKPLPFPKVFQEIAEIEESLENSSIKNYPRMEKRKMELSGEFIFLKKNWKEAKTEKERNIIRGKAENLKGRFLELQRRFFVLDKIVSLKEKIAERIDHLEKNKEKISKEDLKKVEKAREISLKEVEELDENELESSYNNISDIKIIEKKEYENLKKAYYFYFEGKFKEAENFIKSMPPNEKESPYYDFLFTLINLTRYYLEKENNSFLQEAKKSYYKAKEKGLQNEDIKNFPLSPKIFEAIKNF